MILACGACYETRDYPNTCHWVQFDLETRTGTVFLRRYSPERNFWAKDTLTYRSAPDGVYEFSPRGGPVKLSRKKPRTPAPPAPTPSTVPPVQSAATSQGGYDVRIIRELLSDAFSDEEIITLVFDRFRDVYEDISGGMSKTDKVRRLIDWCEHNVEIVTLLAEVQRRNPAQYARYVARLEKR